MARLDFIVIGAQKAGTTSLHEYLAGHAALHLPAGKEHPFFSHDAVVERGWAEFEQRVFADAPADRLWGKATPQYMYGAPFEAAPGAHDEPATVVPRRIAARFPDVRLIALLRDPVERCASHHQMARLSGWDDRGLAASVERLLGPEELARSRRAPRETNSYVTFGEYGRILEPYYDAFPAEQILLLDTARLASDPQSVVSAACRFLEVEDFTPANLGTRYRVGADAPRVALDPWAVQHRIATSSTARRVWSTLPAAARRSAYRRFTTSAYHFGLWNRRATPSGHVDVLPAALRRDLERHYAEDGARLAALTGWSPSWLREWAGARGAGRRPPRGRHGEGDGERTAHQHQPGT